MHRFKLLSLLLLPLWILAAGRLSAEPPVVDFRYAPAQWQTAICLPDDPAKTLVHRSGELLYHFGRGEREFGTRISVLLAEDARWTGQSLVGPRVPIVRTTRQAPGLAIVEEAFAVTEPLAGDDTAGAPADRSRKVPSRNAPSRNDCILVHVTNTGPAARTVTPRLVIDSRLPVAVDLDRQRVTVDGHEQIVSSLKMVEVGQIDDDKRIVQLQPIAIKPGTTQQFCITYAAGHPVVPEPGTLAEATGYRAKAETYWRHVELPYGRVQLPDPTIQALIDSSIRNIWQAREIVDRLPAFQVGPTCYRGLWIVDGAFLLEAATMLGAGRDARNGITYMLSHQKPDGRFEIIDHYYKENGIVLWACVRHAMLTQDKAWLESVWPRLERTVAVIERLRKETLNNETLLDDGLMPPGFPDGGLGRSDRPEYTNVYWNLAGLKAIVAGARWLGKTGQATEWEAEYQAFYSCFQKGAQRDMRTDSAGNHYLPTLMENRDDQLPQRAQWAFCHGVYPGQLFSRESPLVQGNLAMLEATQREGMVYGTGWDAGGIWNYFASFYGHAWLWQGNGRKAAESLVAFANHASPLLAWREEQPPRDEPYRQVGDMPHNWASAEFIRLAIHLIALDRGHELHLFEGLPRQWARPGMVTGLSGVATPFGPLTLELAVAADGQSARLKIDPLADRACEKVIVHLGGLSEAWANRPLDPSQKHEVVIPIHNGLK